MPVAAFIPAIATAGASIYGASRSASAAKSAANTTAQAAANANALQKDIYDKNTVQLQPDINRGHVAGDRYAALLGLGGDAGAANDAFRQYLDSTGYQFQLDQGLNAVTSNRAARGMLDSGATLKALQSYGQDTASKYYGDYLGRLGGLAQQGTAAAGALAGVGMNYAGNAGNNLINAANTSAQAGITGAALGNQAIQSGLGALGTIYGQSSYSRPNPGSYTPASGTDWTGQPYWEA